MNRNTDRISLVLTVLAVMGLGTPGPADAEEYAVIDLGTFGGPSGYGNDINDSGQVAGTADHPGGHPQHPLLWEDGVLTDLGTLGGCCAYGYDISNPGHVTGLSYVADGTYRAYVWEAGVLTDLGALPGFEYSTAGAVNDAGQIVGYSSHTPWGGNADYTAFLWQGGVMIDLHDTLPPGSTWELMFANDINEAGQIVGHGHTPNDDYHAFLCHDGEVTDLGTLPDYDSSSAHSINNVGQLVGGATKHGFYSSTYQAFLWEDGLMVGLGRLTFDNHSGARDINDQGQIVGYSSHTTTSGRRAFLWDDGVMVDLNTLLPPGSDWYLESASAINEAGQIVGYGTISGETRGFLLTPTVPGDVDGDGDVDLEDLAALLAAYGTCLGDPTYNPDADLDGDDCVDLEDLAILLANYGA